MKIPWSCQYCNTENELDTAEDEGGDVLMEMMESAEAKGVNKPPPEEYMVKCKNPKCGRTTKLRVSW